MSVYAPQGNRANTQVLLLNPRPNPSSSLNYLITFPPGFLPPLSPQTPHHYDSSNSPIVTRDPPASSGSSSSTNTPYDHSTVHLPWRCSSLHCLPPLRSLLYISLTIPGTMASGPKHNVVGCQSGFADVYQDALCDVVTMPPAERGKAMVTFDLTAPCQTLSEVVTNKMVSNPLIPLHLLLPIYLPLIASIHSEVVHRVLGRQPRSTKAPRYGRGHSS